MKTFTIKAVTSRLFIVCGLIVSTMLFTANASYADIWEPEGLNMPGGWNGWTNPPVNSLALASYTQVSGGRVTKISEGMPHWQTLFSVAASGADLTGGTYNWLFTSGPSGSPWGNKWAGVNVSMNTLQTYTYNSGSDNSITIVNGKWYTMNWKDSGYTGTQAIFMETSGQPVAITGVSFPAQGTVNVPETITVTLGGNPSAEELFFLRYTTNEWSTSNLAAVTYNGTQWTAVIPGQPDGTIVNYYVFSTTVATITGNYDLYTIRNNNNGGINYTYTVGAAPITWANLESPASGSVNPGESLTVHGRVYIPGTTGQATPAPGVLAWIGYSSSNTNPDTWTNWVSAGFTGPVDNNDDYMAQIGSTLAPGTYYYASRFQLNGGAYVYGGYNGGYWNGTYHVSGILTVNGAAPTVATGNVLSVTGNSATLEGNVIADGGSALTARGICWSTSQNPTVADNFTNEGTATGSFTSLLTSLDPGTTYYARAYATNATGTGYGVEVQFTTVYQLTFLLDMVTCNGFLPGTDSVYLAGGFPNAFWNEPGSNPAFKMTPSGGTQYSITLSVAAGTYEFKYFRNASWAGGEWTGGSNRSVTVSANTIITSTWGGEIEWANLQWPGLGLIETGQSFEVYSQAYIPNGITGSTGGAFGLQAWIGYSTDSVHPSLFTNWIPANYLGTAGANDEFSADLGSAISATGRYFYASRFRFGAGSYYYGGFNSGFWDGTTNYSGVLTVNPPVTTKTLDLKVFLQGLYDGGGMMRKAQDESGDHFPGNVADQITIELHSAADYSQVVYAVTAADLLTDGTVLISSIPAEHTGSYYITVKHRNSIETTTAIPISFSDALISYDFSTDIAKAYGSNLVESGGVYCIFGGDENQDSIVDATDMIDTDNDTSAFATGYLPADVTGDGLVDASDMILVDNNSALFVASAHP